MTVRCVSLRCENAEKWTSAPKFQRFQGVFMLLDIHLLCEKYLRSSQQLEKCLSGIIPVKLKHFCHDFFFFA